jgi:hypothetical protein
MPLPRFRLRTLMIVVPLAGVVLAIEAAAWTGPLGPTLGSVLLLSIDWVPAVFLLLSPRAAGWLSLLAVAASTSSLAFSLWQAAHGDLAPDGGLSIVAVTLWLTFAFGLGYVATKGLHLPGRHPGPDTRPEPVGDAAGETSMAGSFSDPEADEGRPWRPGANPDRPSAGPADAASGSTADPPTARAGALARSSSGASGGFGTRAWAIAALIGVPALVFLTIITWGAILAPLAGLLLLVPFIAANYLLWGRLVATRKPAGRRRRIDDEVA